MRNIYKKILTILPMIVFIGMMSYATPARATGILGSVEQWVSEKWDAATTVGKAAFEALKNGGNPGDIMNAVGSAAAVRRYINEAEGLEQSRETAADVLASVSGIEKGSELSELILGFYDMLNASCSIEDLIRAADGIKHEAIGKVI